MEWTASRWKLIYNNTKGRRNEYAKDVCAGYCGEFLDRINMIDRIKKGQANEEENGVPDENLD